MPGFCRYLLLLTLTVVSGRAQMTDLPPAPPQSPGYPVTGRAVCADNQKAARFAQVLLIPANNNGNGRRLSARTDLDGNFLVPNAPVGDYYVTANLPGYVNQAPLVQGALNTSSDPSTLSGIPLIHVNAGGASTLLSLTRGGIFAGTVNWDDGSPAAGVSVSAQPATGPNTPARIEFNGRGPTLFSPGNNVGAQTDDRGRFRVSGLAPGTYYLRASIQAPAPQRPGDPGFARTLTLTVYAPDKPRRTEATPITVTSGEERADLVLTIGLSALHSVTGAVSSSAAPVRSGTANLTDQADSSLSRNVRLTPDGSFVIPYVPAGTYTLRINASSQALTDVRGNRDEDRDAARFQPMEESITVTDTDLTGLSITVTQATASQ